MIAISHIDHIVLTVSDVEASCNFYSTVLGMSPVCFAGGRKALRFGNQKINLHESGKEFLPKAMKPTPGSADICLITNTPLSEVLQHLASKGIPVEEGIVERTGATASIHSIYFRDPDGNLLEVASYL